MKKIILITKFFLYNKKASEIFENQKFLTLFNYFTVFNFFAKADFFLEAVFFLIIPFEQD